MEKHASHSILLLTMGNFLHSIQNVNYLMRVCCVFIMKDVCVSYNCHIEASINLKELSVLLMLIFVFHLMLFFFILFQGPPGIPGPPGPVGPKVCIPYHKHL